MVSCFVDWRMGGPMCAVQAHSTVSLTPYWYWPHRNARGTRVTTHTVLLVSAPLTKLPFVLHLTAAACALQCPSDHRSRTRPT